MSHMEKPIFQIEHNCYFPLVFEDLKSFDIQTIYAIMGANLAVLGVARSLSFWNLQIVPKFALTTQSHESIF